MKHVKHIAIIGAGITGVLSAYYLAKDGYSVTLYEQEKYPGMRCSYANGGQISVSNSESWHSWSNVLKGIKWLTKKDAPLLIRPGFDPDRIKWLIQFLLNTAKNKREQITAKTIAMGLESRLLYQEIIDTEKINFDFKPCGILHFYKNRKYFESAKSVQELYEKNGCDWQILSSGDVFKLEPALKSYNDPFMPIIGGVWTESDWVGDIHKFCVELTNVLITKYKVIFRPLNEITNDRLSNLIDIYDNVVVCAGVESRKISRYLGDTCTIYPVKGYSVTIDVKDKKQLPITSLLDDQAKIVATTLGNKLRIAGTAELCGYNYDIVQDRIKPLLNWVHTHLPAISTEDYSSWACLRPMTSDMLPMVKRSRYSTVLYNTGHGHLGWTVGPATSKQLLNLISV